MQERTKEIYTPEGGPPQGKRPPVELLVALGEPGVFALLSEFYKRLGTSEVRSMFPKDPDSLEEASKKSAAFFVQVLGGRPLFSQYVGPPRMRMRHFPFEIDASARATWLHHFEETVTKAVHDGTFPSEHRVSFVAFLHSFSSWMVNVDPDLES